MGIGIVDFPSIFFKVIPKIIQLLNCSKLFLKMLKWTIETLGQVENCA